VQDAAGTDFDAAALAIDHEGRGPDTLQRIAELAPGRAHVIGFIADADQVISRVLDGANGNAGAVVAHADAIVLDVDLHHRRHVVHLGSIEAVVDQFLDQRDGPPATGMADLHVEFFLREKL
jgi:hypothetical protein